MKTRYGPQRPGGLRARLRRARARGLSRRLPRPRQRRAGPGRRPGRLPQAVARAGEVRRAPRASSAPTCGSWRAAARSTRGARGRPPAARRIASSSTSPATRGAPTSARPSPPSAQGSGARCAPPCASCPPVQREAVVLAYWGGLTADQIARRSNVPLGHGQEPHPPGPGPPAPRLRADASRGELAAQLVASGGRCPSTPASSTSVCCPSSSTGAIGLGAGRLVRRPHPHRAERSRRAQGHPRGDPRRPRRRRPPPGDALRDARARRLPGGQRRRPGRRGRLRGAPRGARAHRPERRRRAWPRRERCLEAGATRLQAAPALGRLRPAAPGRRAGRGAGPRAPRARALPRRAAGSRTSARRSSTSPGATPARA